MALDLERMDVCFIASTLNKGGAERQLAYAVQALQDAGTGVRIVSLDEGGFWEGTFRARGIPVHSLAGYPGKVTRLAKLLALLRRRPTVIHACHFSVNLYACAAARLMGTREIGAVRGDLDYTVKTWGPVYGPSSLHCPRLLAVNSHRAFAAAHARGMRTERLFMLPNVVDVDLYHPRTEARKGPFTLLFVGRNVPQKRVDRFLRLLAEVRLVAGQDVHGVVVGKPGQGIDSVTATCKRLGLPPSAVELRGSMEPSAVASIYRQADLFVLTSDVEGTPNALMEAMASGLPCVATDSGDVARLLDDNRGRVIGAGDESALRQAVLEVLASEPLRTAMAERCRAFIVREHSLSGLTDHLRQLYSICLSG